MSTQYLVKRTAFANITHPGHASATASVQTGAYIPAGAIVTGIRVMAGGAVTLADNSDATMTPYVGTLALGSNDEIISVNVIQTQPHFIDLAGASGTIGIHVSAGGYLDMDFGSTHTDSTDSVADFDIYVDYLFTADHD